MAQQTPLDEARFHPGEVFEATLAAARFAEPMIDLGDGRRRVFVPRDMSLQNVDDPFALPPHIRQSVVVDTRDSLTNYANRFSDERSILVADYDTGQIGAILDYHSSNESVSCGELQAGPGKHVVALKLRDSEEFRRWNEIQGQQLPQDEFAVFLEENASDIVDPDPAVMIEISRDLEAAQGVSFKSSYRTDNGDRAFRYETETRTNGDLTIPKEFRLAIPLWNGEEPVELRCAFRWSISGGGLKLGFVWRRVEYQRRAYFAQIATLAAEHTGLPVFFGRLAP